MQAPKTNSRCDQWPLHSEIAISTNTISLLNQERILRWENKKHKLKNHLCVALKVSHNLANNHIQQ